MTSRERVRLAINHQKPDRIPLDLGSTYTTGIQAKAYIKLIKCLNLSKRHIKVFDPYQMLADVDDDVRESIGIDTIGIQLPYTIFGFKNENWKLFKKVDDFPLLVSGNMEYDIDEHGDIYVYPMGDRTSSYSAKMPKDGYYFDAIVRQKAFNEDSLDAKKWVEETYSLYTDEDLKYLENMTNFYYENTNYSLIGNFAVGNFGDIAFVPGPHIIEPTGIRDPEEWYVSLITRREYIKDIFNYQLKISIRNLDMLKDAVGNKIDIVTVSGADFGSQNGPFISVDLYRELFKPFHKKVNDWIHKNTNWKTWYHSCGSIADFIPDFIDSGVDILNPVQISAKGMDPKFLKDNYGDKIVFWGGGIDTQKTLPFDSKEKIEEEIKSNIEIFGKDGGFVFATVHNIQGDVPAENICKLFNTLNKIRGIS